jgi:hypothetical protein
MPKINYHRGETRDFVRHRDPGTWGRKRHTLAWTRTPARSRTDRGQKGLIKNYRDLGRDSVRIGVRNWCPCCVDFTWDRRLRSARTRRENKRQVHRTLRKYDRELCLQGLAEYESDDIFG